MVSMTALKKHYKQIKYLYFIFDLTHVITGGIAEAGVFSVLRIQSHFLSLTCMSKCYPERKFF